jgi:hypothetical protein
MKKVQDVAGRIVAVFLSSALAIVGGSAVIAPELQIWKSAVLAGFAACATVVQKLAQSSLDGNLTMDEINDAFGAKKK